MTGPGLTFLGLSFINLICVPLPSDQQSLRGCRGGHLSKPPWITPAFSPESSMSFSEEKDPLAVLLGRLFGVRDFFGVFPDSPHEAVESSHICPGTPMGSKGQDSGGQCCHRAALWPTLRLAHGDGLAEGTKGGSLSSLSPRVVSKHLYRFWHGWRLCVTTALARAAVGLWA